MDSKRFPRHRCQLGSAGFLVPLLGICATLLALVLISRPASFEDEASAQPATNEPAPYVGSDPSLPAAGSVFPRDNSYESAPVVATF